VRPISLIVTAMKHRGGLSFTPVLVLVAGSLVGLTACSEDSTGKNWSALATCLAGPAANAPVVERVPKIRQMLLGNSAPSAGKDAWPARCAPMADDLYAGLDKSGKGAGLKRKLHDRFGCTDSKGSCKITGETALISTTTELWESAKSADLKVEAVSGTATPPLAPPPLLDSKVWKSFAEKPMRVSGPVLTEDGRALLVLKPAEGRARPTVCEVAAGFAKMKCVKGSDKIPELPPQSIEIVADDDGLYAAGLTEKGMVAYAIDSGETSDVRARGGRMIRNGVVVEKAQTEDISVGDPNATKPAAKGGKPAMFQKPKGAKPDEGFVAVELKNGKASKEIKLPIEGQVGNPTSIGNQALWITPTEGGVELNTRTIAGGRLGGGGKLKGTFAGTFNTCERGGAYALAVFGSKAGQGASSKPTGGEGKTAVTFTRFEKGSWSKPVETTMPFERAGESALTCTPDGASLAWMKAEKGTQTAPANAVVGRIDCKADGCKSNEVTIPGLDSSYLWAVGTLGDKVFVLYRGVHGETRLRVASLSDLPTTKDSIVFDVNDYGGPSTGELSVLATDTAALLLFRGERGEQPTALRLANDGAVSMVSL
jgi:hypothetical protein